MTKPFVTLILAAHLVLCWSAVALRIDRFPLTWAPMYSVYKAPKRDTYRVSYRDKAWLKKRGWRATHRDSSQSWVNQRDLNLPTRNMWRLYYQRTYEVGPPKYKHINHDADTWDRWLWGLEPGENYYDIDWHHRLLTAVNKTFGLEPSDARFIVSLDARRDRFVFDREDLTFRGTIEQKATATWDEDWSGGF